MAYQKMTPASWLKKVKDGEFDDASKAAKSMGRAAWSDKTKSKMRNFVDLYFSGGEIQDKDIELAGDDGGVPDKKPKKQRGKNSKPKVATKPAVKQPAKAATKELDFIDRLEAELPPDPYRSIKNTIATTHMALVAFKVAHEADPEVEMPDEIQECVDLLSACVRAVLDRITPEVREALEGIRAEVAAITEANKKPDEPEKEPAPKALRVATPAALPQKFEVRPDGVPLESNQEGGKLWNKLVKIKRSNGKDKRD